MLTAVLLVPVLVLWLVMSCCTSSKDNSVASEGKCARAPDCDELLDASVAAGVEVGAEAEAEADVEGLAPVDAGLLPKQKARQAVSFECGIGVLQSRCRLVALPDAPDDAWLWRARSRLTVWSSNTKRGGVGVNNRDCVTCAPHQTNPPDASRRTQAGQSAAKTWLVGDHVTLSLVLVGASCCHSRGRGGGRREVRIVMAAWHWAAVLVV